MPEHGQDFVAGDFFRIEQQVDSHVLEHQFVLRQQVVLVINTGDDPFGPQALGQLGADDVDGLGLVGIDGDEKVRLGAAGAVQEIDGRKASFQGHDVCGGRECGQPLRVVVDNGDFTALHREQFRQVRSDLAGSFDNDFHIRLNKALGTIQWG